MRSEPTLVQELRAQLERVVRNRHLVTVYPSPCSFAAELAIADAHAHSAWWGTANYDQRGILETAIRRAVVTREAP